jgi:hypothetical protein
MLTTVPADLAEKARNRAERERARKARSRASWAADNRKRHDGKALSYSEYPFVMWDGEAPQDTGYSLFGSSLGHEVCRPHLTTEDCFDLLLQAKTENPDTIFIMFGSRYDFDEIIRQSMPSDRLARIKWFGAVTWHGYTVKQAEGKWFSIRKNGVTVKVFEIFGWFNTAYVKALEDYGIGTAEEREILRKNKEKRPEFLFSEIEGIKRYMRLELKLGPVLMEHVRSLCLQAGFNPRAWYGPSALATEMLRRNGIKEFMSRCPDPVNRAAQQAYAAGRFEMFRGGILSPVYQKDINSAYVRAMLELPNLTTGSWRLGRTFEPGKFGVYRIRYRHSQRFNHTYPMPLFRRLQNGTVCWPATVENWYWSPEAELVANDPDAKFLEAWIYDDDGSRPFEFVREVYRKRLLLKNLPKGNPSREAEKAFKWALAAIYGQLCRTVGWDEFRRKPPAFHQLEWAGYITSWCRAQVWKVAVKCGDNLVSIDTDSVTAMCPIEGTDDGIELGQWEPSEADRGVFYQSGVYFLEKDGTWIYTRLRGVDYRGKRPPVKPEDLITAIRNGKAIRITPKARYISIRQSLGWGLKLQGQWIQPEDLETLVFGGQGKRFHNAKHCRDLCSGDCHVFLPAGNLGNVVAGNPVFDFERILYWSKPHTLPWLKPRDSDVALARDYLWVDTENMDVEDYWKLELVE